MTRTDHHHHHFGKYMALTLAAALVAGLILAGSGCDIGAFERRRFEPTGGGG